MKNVKRTVSIITALGCFAFAGIFYLQKGATQTPATSISGKFYKLDVLATSTELGVWLSTDTSINDNGNVAFASQNRLFTADGVLPVRTIATSSFNLNFNGGHQINNNNLLLTHVYSSSTGSNRLFTYDASQASPVPTDLTIGGGVGPIPPESLSLNNSGQPAFIGSNAAGGLLVTGELPTFNTVSIPGALSFRPVVADNGSVVLREGDTSTSQIRLYNYTLTTPTDIATVSSTTFSALGQSPGISDDGKVIVFYGVAQTGNSIPTNPGPGIFASIVDGGTRRVIRIAGRKVENVSLITGNRDGVCDTGEQCVPGELGFITSGTGTTPVTFGSFGADSRIGVIHRADELPEGIDNDTFIVTFLGTPSSASDAPRYFSNQLGLWTIRVDMKTEGGSIREKPFRATPVIQVGDNLGASTQVTGLSIYDPIAFAATDDAGMPRVQSRPDHRLVFQASTVNGATNGTAIVRASYTDGDEDGLADHWERTGIDFNQDMVIDLALNNPLPGDPSGVGANPQRKDVYVEIDYMQRTIPSIRTHRPDYAPNNVALAVPIPPMTAVRNAFAEAPVRNVNRTLGVTLHNFVDEPVPEVPLLLFPQTGPNANDDFDDFKFGSNGTSAGSPCGLGPNDGHFGTPADRGTGGTPNPNCINILGARRLVFRYALFAQTLPLTTTPDPRVLGRAEFAGNDMVIAFSMGIANPKRDVQVQDSKLAERWGTTFDYEHANRQAGTFMHELGHTLGLRHGGADDLKNCKPNYLSVMNYARQSYYGGVSYGDTVLADKAPVRLNPARSLDYAREPALSTLTESSLNEGAGIGGPSNQQTIYGVPAPSPLPSPLPLGFTNARISPANVALDWNGNGIIDPTPVLNMDINRIIGGGCKDPSPGDTLTGYDDWSNLKYNFFSTYNFTDSSARLTDIDGPEQTLEETVDGGLGSPDVDGDGVSNVDDNCLLSPNALQSDSNGNGIGDACDASTTTLADLSISVTTSASSVQINTPFDYIATIRNAGPSASQNVNFTNQLPANVIFNSVTPNQGSCSGTSSITCNLGTINSSSIATVTIRVTPTVRGKLDNWVNTNSGGGSPTADPNILNNTNSVSTTILDPSQTFTISGRIADGSSVGIGGAFVVYSGASQGTAITDASGNYSFTAISGGIYILTPVRFGFSFSPQSRTVAYIDSNQVVNFTGVPATTTAKNADFDGDGRTDLSVFRPSDPNWYVLRSSNSGYQVTAWGLSTDKTTPGDYDGDGKTDHAVFRPSDTVWYILQSSTNTFTGLQWGLSTDIPVAGDYDGDGKTDAAIWRASEGNWYAYQSSNQSAFIVNYGQNGDIPLGGDFDGDRKTDFAFFRPSTAAWNILRSTGGTVVRQFGLFDDKLVPADFDGDGTTDFGVWRPSTGFWYTAPSSEPNPGQNFTALPFGQSGDIPIPGDYDGDGKYDRAVFRNGTWFIQNLANNTISILNFGLSGDKPVPNAYLPQ